MIKPEDVIQFASKIVSVKKHLESQVKSYKYMSENMGSIRKYIILYKYSVKELENFNLIMGEIE